jgi:hypothetical protein
MRTRARTLRPEGDVAPIGIGSVLARFPNRALLALIGDEASQWLVARHYPRFGVRGGVEIVQFMVRAALDASPDWADMQGDASNAFLRCPLFEELSANSALQPLVRVATMLYGVHSPCTFTTHQLLMTRLCVSRVPVESIKVAFSGPCSSQ